MRKRLSVLLALAVAVAMGLAVVPTSAFAANGDILLGAFFTSEEDQTDTVYASYDGQTFYALGTPYQDATPSSTASNAYASGHYTHKCPGICYYNGYFWMISNWDKADGKFWPMLSYSKDLIHWTTPEGTYLGAGYNGVSLAQQPDNKPGAFNVVAPKMHVASDGNLYITFSAGNYTDNGDTDKMQVYTCKVTKLSATDGTASADGSGTLRPHITFSTEPAQKVSAPAVKNDASANIIDSNIYAEGNTTYLLLKRDGLTEEIYSSQSPDDPSSWALVDANASYGYEGVAVAKANGVYYLFGDGVRGTKPLGVRAVTSSSITRDGLWSDSKSTSAEKLHELRFVGTNGQAMTARHGDVVTLKAGTAEWNLVNAQLSGKADSSQVPTAMYRLYNANSGEHFYTASESERDGLLARGWKSEGTGWLAPTRSDTPVYRLYSGTDHHYTTSIAERDSLVAAGWTYEGVGWYSDDGKSTPIYRQFNPNVDPAAASGNSGSHNYTSSKAENDSLARQGWRVEGIGWYGL